LTFKSLGRINQPAPGTPVPLSTDATARAAKVFFQVIPGLTGKAYIGAPGMNKTTLAGVARVLWPNSSGGISDQFLIETGNGLDEINLSEYVIDMDVAGEGVLFSYWTE
jgi:hypothetical protein